MSRRSVRARVSCLALVLAHVFGPRHAVADEIDAALSSQETKVRIAALRRLRALGPAGDKRAATAAAHLYRGWDECHEARAALLAMGAGAHRALIDRALSEQRGGVRPARATILMAGKEIAPALFAELKGSAPSRQLPILELLGRLGPLLDESDAKALVELLAAPGPVGDAAALAIARISPATGRLAVPRLITMLGSANKSSDEAVVLPVLTAFCLLGREAGPEAERALAAAAVARGEEGDLPCQLALWRVGKDRAAVERRILGRIASAPPGKRLLEWRWIAFLGRAAAPAVPQLLDDLASASKEQTSTLIDVFRCISAPDAALVKRVLGDDSPAAEEIAGELLRLPDLRAEDRMDLLRKTVSAESEWVQIAGIGNVITQDPAPSPEIIRELGRLATHERSEYAGLVLLNLQHVGAAARPASKSVETLLESESDRGLAMRVLGAMGQCSPSTLRTMIDACRDESSCDAAWALGRNGDRSAEVVAVLREGLRSPEPEYALACAVALVRLGDAEGEAAAAVVAALRSNDDEVTALHGLYGGPVPSPRVFAAVEEACGGGSLYSRALAAEISHGVTGDDATMVRRVAPHLLVDTEPHLTGLRLEIPLLLRAKREHVPLRPVLCIRYDLQTEPDELDVILPQLRRAGLQSE